MSLTYSTFVTSLANLFPVASTDVNFQTVLPNIIDDAEQRIYRDLDLLNTVVHDASSTIATGQHGFTIPSTNGTFVVVEGINVITPAGAATPVAGTRNPLIPASQEMIDSLWPSVAGSTVPQYFAMITQGSVYVAPWPDQPYLMEVYGTIRPTPLSVSNPTTLLTQYFPDLFLAASMVFGSAYMKNFSAAADDPKMATTWEGHYQTLLQSAMTEEMRKKFNMAGWSPKQPAPMATPPRT